MLACLEMHALWARAFAHPTIPGIPELMAWQNETKGSRPRRPEQRLEFAAQHHVDLRHCHRHAEIDQARHAIALAGNSARHDAGKVHKLGLDIERNAMERDPAFHSDADGGDLVLTRAFNS